MSYTKSYTAEEVAAKFKITKYTVFNMIKRGDLTGYRIDGNVRIDADVLDAYIQKSKSQSPAMRSKSINSGTSDGPIIYKRGE